MVGGTTPDGLVPLLGGDACRLQRCKIAPATIQEILQPCLTARHQFAAEMGQHVGRTFGKDFIIDPGDGLGHPLTGGVGHLIQQNRLLCFPPEVIQGILTVGIQIHHGRPGKIPVGQYPVHGAELIVGQRPVGVRRNAVSVKGAGPDLHPGLGQLTQKGLGRRRIGDQCHRTTGILRLGAAKGHHGTPVIDSAPQIGIVSFPVSFQRGESAEDQILHAVLPSCVPYTYI